MKIQQLKWCGEGDLLSCGALKRRKLYTSRSPENTKSARNTNPSHTASHTASKNKLRSPHHSGVAL
jgi:hypothetical protein